jgi:hypothetical protein
MLVFSFSFSVSYRRLDQMSNQAPEGRPFAQEVLERRHPLGDPICERLPTHIAAVRRTGM